MEKIDYIDFSELQTFDKITAAADNYDTVHQLEEVLMIWYRQIERVSYCFNISIQHEYGQVFINYM